MSYNDSCLQMGYKFKEGSVGSGLFKILCEDFYHRNYGKLFSNLYYYDNLNPEIRNVDGLIGGRYSRVNDVFSYLERYKYADAAGRPIEVLSMPLESFGEESDYSLEYSIVGRMHFIDKFGPLHRSLEFPEMIGSDFYDDIFLCEFEIQVPNEGLHYWIQIQSEGARIDHNIKHTNFKISIYDANGYVEFKASEPDAQQEKSALISYIPNTLDPNLAIVLDGEGNEIGNVSYKELLDFFKVSNMDYEKILSSKFPSFHETNKSTRHF